VQDQLEDPAQFLANVKALYGQADLERLEILRFKDGRVYERYSRPQRDGATIVGRVCSFRDITQRERLLRSAEEARVAAESAAGQLRALAARLDAVREEERRLMAREIHDQVGQALTALKLELASLRSRLPAGTDGEVGARAEAMDRLLDETLDTTRRLSTELRPPILDDLGLGAAIEWQVRDFEARTGVRATTEVPAERIGAREGLALFRIVQEALTNVVRHAGARSVRVRLAIGPDALVLTIADDGRGITTLEQARPTALGLVGMRERALVLGGEVTISGAPGVGTTVTARLPWVRPA
jgi:signal transduction histidine kinase